MAAVQLSNPNMQQSNLNVNNCYFQLFAADTYNLSKGYLSVCTGSMKSFLPNVSCYTFWKISISPELYVVCPIAMIFVYIKAMSQQYKDGDSHVKDKMVLSLTWGYIYW